MEEEEERGPARGGGASRGGSAAFPLRARPRAPSAGGGRAAVARPGGGGRPGPRCPSPPASVGTGLGCPPRPQSPCRCAPTPRGQVHSGPRLRPLPAAAWGARVGALAPARGGLGVREFSIRFFLGPRSAQGFSH